jgi:ferredoxin
VRSSGVADLRRSAEEFMAILSQRVPQNVAGRYYVDEQCIYCDLCVEIAPSIFKEYKERGWAYVFHQPESKEEEALASEAIKGCPTESIGRIDDQVRTESPRWWQFWKISK